MPAPRKTVLATATTTVAGVAMALAATLAGGSAGPAHSAASSAAPAASQAPNAVVDWNDVLARLVDDRALQPATVHSTRSMAIMNAAVYDAVAAIDGDRQYLTSLERAPGASQSAAAATASAEVLAGLYPRVATSMWHRLDGVLAAMPADRATQRGITVGAAAATAVLQLRAHDGSDVIPPRFVPTRVPGRFQPVPPHWTPPVLRQWGRVQPFLLTSSQQFRVGAPPALGSTRYATSYGIVKALGSASSSTRTREQTLAAKFWNAPIQDFWNQATRETALARHLDVADSARLYAAVDLGLADTAIALYDSKYAYDLWRPVTAIRAGGTDANPATRADGGWTPLEPTPSDPSYPGAHGALSAAAAAILDAFFGGDRAELTLTSPVLPGVVRHFRGFTAAANEAGLSRIWAGVHFPTDDAAGRRLGREVAAHAITVLRVRPVHPSRRQFG